MVDSGLLCSDFGASVDLSYHYPVINMLSAQTLCVIVSCYLDVTHDRDHISEPSLCPHGYIK